MADNTVLQAHRQWLGLLQPVGLVVSPLALVRAGAIVNHNVFALQQELQDLLAEARETADGIDNYPIDFERFAGRLLGWEADDLAGSADGPELPEDLSVALPDLGELLTPRYAVFDLDAERKGLLLVQVLPPGADLDAATHDSAWTASAQARMERLLRENEISIGILWNSRTLRLIYYPKGESSGHLDFPVETMATVGGRPILGALQMLLGADRLFNLPADRRLEALLAASRKYQNEVSNRLADQVLDALWELLRGFQMADEAADGRLLGEVARSAPSHIYGGLIAVLMRLVFLLYAEDRGLMPQDPIYERGYSLTGLFERLRIDWGNYPDTMDQRFGAWAALLSLFRLAFEGAAHGEFSLPARQGQLFNPDEYPFLEGRPWQTNRVMGERIQPPRVPDGVIYRVLDKLLVLGGERLSYRSLDVEQIGSVYEAVMGFAVERAGGRSIGLTSKPKGSKVSVTVVVDLDRLLATKPGERAKWLKDNAGCEVTGNALNELKKATTPEQLNAALEKRISKRTAGLLPAGSLYLQPGEERRRTGSHYTPRTLTEPIVRHTLEPVIANLGAQPTADQILNLKICDPAMGSGAFLVEACRQLAEHLVEAWNVHRSQPAIPADEDPLLHARRLVAQRCLYGVDKNPFAVNLAKLSLWLVTLAKEHPFTFLDHALKHGDSLVGLGRENIGAFSWIPQAPHYGPLFQNISRQIDDARHYREQIADLGDDGDTQKRQLHKETEDALAEARLAGDLIVAAYFSSEKDAAREAYRKAVRQKFEDWQSGSDYINDLLSIAQSLREQEKPLPPFHWEIEFPEVFGRTNPGFDCFIGNPPFAGKNTTINSNPEGYLDWLKVLHPGSHGNADIVAHFFRRTFNLLNQGGTIGLIATNTIAQGDTRSTGLRWICLNEGTIYRTQKRLKWPGLAAVVVSVVNIHKGMYSGQKTLDGIAVPEITAFLFHTGGSDDPVTLEANAGKSFQGSILLGMGFTFDDTNAEASPVAEMERLIQKDPRNAERIFPYIGGDEVNNSPTHAHRRYVINFADFPLQRENLGKSWFVATEREQETWLRSGIVPADYPGPVAVDWPDLLHIVEEKVKPRRLLDNRASYRKFWWQFAEKRTDLFQAIQSLTRVLVINCGASKFISFTWLQSNTIYANTLDIIVVETDNGFGILQSRIHEIWARFFGSSMKDDLRYTPSDCFETFPFPESWGSNLMLEAAGQEYYGFRAALMIRNNQGLTDTYNRFHDPNEFNPDILELRELHAAMDRAVLNAYGWTDIPTGCEFLLDYEDEESEEESSSRQKKKPWRYRWPDEVRDEVLARLLELNRQRAEEEQFAGLAAQQAPAKRKGGPRARKPEQEPPALPGL
ncbi:Eco57I restriction-modification methylase domain-containing protein [Gloeobacter kilaueensis]|uniref:site-specific DNA-methyltransferase (adenine-specific) n=1 Tax=Gloeobacter kilaueensis (strain ATCC BAA-2537 / CCAP 1431/1 / ULC 316 / JS1) TaxID=1183438 RepID=U5QDL3_GLOK1|nr:DNA methyltransferase [Gloeobacter kilaueensis]AGY56938.1 type I restriction-modification system methyltransferase subunit [Gloeobacter kilaueensis JS1]